MDMKQTARSDDDSIIARIINPENPENGPINIFCEFDREEKDFQLYVRQGESSWEIGPGHKCIRDAISWIHSSYNNGWGLEIL